MFKASNYNKILTLNNGKKIAFNSISCALAEVDNEFIDILEKIKTIEYDNLADKDKELINSMLEGNYIIDNSVDELKMIKYNHLSAKFSSGVLSLTIAPTIDCNFACPYCYETPKKGFMDKTVQEAILKMIKDSAKSTRKIYISWYGGEPLLAKDIVLYLSGEIKKICNENEIEYSASMVTNGFLLNRELIDKLNEVEVNSYQITIDGPPEIHNERRRLRGEKKDTFNKLVENIKLLKEKNNTVNIRVNVDNSNKDRVDELFDILAENDLKDLNINIGHVKDHKEGCFSLGGSCLNNKEYAEYDFECRQSLKKRDFNIGNELYYPEVKSNYCCADSSTAFVIDPEGYMYKCWCDVGNIDSALANVKKLKDVSDNMYMNNIKYMLWSPFEFEKCVECWLLPICMGGCPYNGIINDNNPECEKWKYIIEKSLIDTYDNSCINKEV